MSHTLRFTLVSALLLLSHSALAQEEDNPWGDVEEEAPKPTAPKDMDTPKKEEPAATPDKKIWRVTLFSGEVLTGTLLSSSPNEIMLRLPNGQNRVIARANISKLTSGNPSDNPTPKKAPTQAQTRYLYSPSAFMLKQGEAYFSQKELFFSSFGIGLTDNVSLLLGSALPFFFTPGGQNLILGAKFGGNVSEGFHLAAGFETVIIAGLLDQSTLIALPFVAATLGDKSANLTLNIGGFSAFRVSPFQDEFSFPLASFSGYYAIDRSLGFVTEHIVLLPSESNGFSSGSGSAHAIALRILIEAFSIDVGVATAQTNGNFAPLPIPWLDFSWAFKSFE